MVLFGASRAGAAVSAPRTRCGVGIRRGRHGDLWDRGCFSGEPVTWLRFLLPGDARRIDLGLNGPSTQVENMPDLIAQGAARNPTPTNHPMAASAARDCCGARRAVGRQPQSSPSVFESDSAAASSPIPATADGGTIQSVRDKARHLSMPNAGAAPTADRSTQNSHVAAPVGRCLGTVRYFTPPCLAEPLSGYRLRVTREPTVPQSDFLSLENTRSIRRVPGSISSSRRTTFTLARRPGFSGPGGHAGHPRSSRAVDSTGQAAGEDISWASRQESRARPDANATSHFAASLCG